MESELNRIALSMRRKLDNKDLFLDHLTDNTLDKVNGFLNEMLKDLNSEKA